MPQKALSILILLFLTAFPSIVKAYDLPFENEHEDVVTEITAAELDSRWCCEVITFHRDGTIDYAWIRPAPSYCHGKAVGKNGSVTVMQVHSCEVIAHQ